MEELLLKYINGECSDSEKELVVKWIDSSPENMREYLAFRKLSDITIWQDFSEEHIDRKPMAESLHKKKILVFEVLKIAAVFAIAFFSFKQFYPEPKAPEQPVVLQTMHVPAGQRAELTLEDGTKVWLNANTTLIFPNRFSAKSREVKLDGEGFFEVTSSKLRPFIVNTAKYNVKVWGTKFNLKAYSKTGNFSTSLIEGSVEVLGKEEEKGIFLKPNQSAVNLSNGEVKVAPIEDLNQFLWKDGIIYFDNLSFSEMITKLELYFDISIEVKSKNILAYHCTGKFRTKDGIEHILEVLKLRNKFNYNIDYKLNKITIE